MQVAELDIHIDKIAPESIKPATSIDGRKPTKEITESAIRSCRCQRSMAFAIINPPINKTIMGCMYSEEVSFIDWTPVIGKNTRGMSAVTGMGTASVTHQTAMRTSKEKTSQAFLAPCGSPTDSNSAEWGPISKTIRTRKGPRNRPSFSRFSQLVVIFDLGIWL